MPPGRKKRKAAKKRSDSLAAAHLPLASEVDPASPAKEGRMEEEEGAPEAPRAVVVSNGEKEAKLNVDASDSSDGSSSSASSSAEERLEPIEEVETGATVPVPQSASIPLEEAARPVDVVEVPSEEEVATPVDVVEVPPEKVVTTPVDVVEVPPEEEVATPVDVVEVPPEEEVATPVDVVEVPPEEEVAATVDDVVEPTLAAEPEEAASVQGGTVPVEAVECLSAVEPASEEKDLAVSVPPVEQVAQGSEPPPRVESKEMANEVQGGLAPRVAGRTSWLSCCGLLDAFRGSRR